MTTPGFEDQVLSAREFREWALVQTGKYEVWHGAFDKETYYNNQFEYYDQNSVYNDSAFVCEEQLRKIEAFHTTSDSLHRNEDRCDEFNAEEYLTSGILRPNQNVSNTFSAEQQKLNNIDKIEGMIGVQKLRDTEAYSSNLIDSQLAKCQSFVHKANDYDFKLF